MFDPPNLDDMSVDPKDYEEAARVLTRLAEYATWKADAMRRRLSGRVSEAVTREEICDRIYLALPKWARW